MYGWVHQPNHKSFKSEFVQPTRYEEIKLKQELRVQPANDCPNLRHMRDRPPMTLYSPILQTGTYHNCALKGFTQQLRRTDEEIHMQTLGRVQGILWMGGRSLKEPVETTTL